jgi:ketosteroid isomerase-like protein
MTGNTELPGGNVAVISQAYEFFAGGRIEDALASYAPEIEWRLAEHHPYAPADGIWTTPGAVVDGLFDRVTREWQAFRCVPTRMLDAGDHVVVEGRYSARYAATQLTEDAQFCHIWELRNGQITSFQQYVDTAQLRAVMGITTPAHDRQPTLFGNPDGVDATWIHRGARTGFEIATVRAHGDGHRLVGHTSATEDGAAWAVGYVIDLDAHWRTIGARLTETIGAGDTTMTIESDRAGQWTVDGTPVPELDGCIDIDLESSALTNTIFLHRVQPSSPHVHDAPAAFIRCAPLRAQRIEQTYQLTERNDSHISYGYTSPAYDTDVALRFDPYGLVTDYPGLAVRHS